MWLSSHVSTDQIQWSTWLWRLILSRASNLAILWSSDALFFSHLQSLLLLTCLGRLWAHKHLISAVIAVIAAGVVITTASPCGFWHWTPARRCPSTWGFPNRPGLWYKHLFLNSLWLYVFDNMKGADFTNMRAYTLHSRWATIFIIVSHVEFNLNRVTLRTFEKLESLTQLGRTNCSGLTSYATWIITSLQTIIEKNLVLCHS